MQQPRAAFEHLQFSVLQERDLAEGLTRQMIGLATLEGDRADGVAETGFLTRPSEPEIAHETTRAFGNPVEGPDGEFAHRSESFRPCSFMGARHWKGRE